MMLTHTQFIQGEWKCFGVLGCAYYAGGWLPLRCPALRSLEVLSTNSGKQRLLAWRQWIKPSRWRPLPTPQRLPIALQARKWKKHFSAIKEDTLNTYTTLHTN